MKVGAVFHAISLEHSAGPRHPERAERLVAIRDHLGAGGLSERLEWHEPEPAPRERLELVHDPAMVDALFDLDARGGGRIDLDTSMSPGSLEAALRGSQGTIDAAERVLDGVWDGALVCMRPPGHHATTRAAMGFCLTNHVAVAARWMVHSGRVSRVAVIDWDAHHGNGTQDIFWDDPHVLYASIHQYPWYPGTGDATERGDGAGRGLTLNVPLPAGAAEDAYERSVDEIVAPALAGFEPELVFVSAGFDAHHRDPLCMMRLTSGAFFRLARRVAAWGPGPVCVLEGGYDLEALGWSCAATVSALLGDDGMTAVPPGEQAALVGSPEAMRWVERAAALQTGR